MQKLLTRDELVQRLSDFAATNPSDEEMIAFLDADPRLSALALREGARAVVEEVAAAAAGRLAT